MLLRTIYNFLLHAILSSAGSIDTNMRRTCKSHHQVWDKQVSFGLGATQSGKICISAQEEQPEDSGKAVSHLPVSRHARHEALAHSRLHACHVLLDSLVGAAVGPGGHAGPAQRAQVVQEHCGVVDSGVAVVCMHKMLVRQEQDAI